MAAGSPLNVRPTINYLATIKLSLPAHPPRHLLNGAALGGEVGVDVEVEGGGDGTVAEEGGDGLVVAAAFDAAGGEAVPQGVEADGRNVEPPQELAEVCPIVAGLHRGGGVGDDVMVGPHDLDERAEGLHQGPANRDVAHGVGGLANSKVETASDVGGRLSVVRHPDGGRTDVENGRK